jgi:hypothetical protein
MGLAKPHLPPFHLRARRVRVASRADAISGHRVRRVLDQIDRTGVRQH